MSARFVGVLGRPPTATGFGLTGLAAEPLAPGGDPIAAVQAALRRADRAVLLLEESIYDALPADTRRRMDRAVRPVVVPFPGPTGPVRRSAEERVVELLRRAIGYRVRLR